ncbi:MAG: bifunctional [glutamate--ammonia ligase]-adenylyl-L-tyrosine phosphorylase/[glutamate--ammonia-ligase] adenylyltransferase [Proteobacteria bacterium]|nr:bifunctional [glutamate--ammonia ligase]-adenylyl-L-tyrosine phosphorylase/[glutamate--ammonia-ligase] adenylyltransferase [Pseudomonadota bacterium]MBU1390061.1 bifunctional [glutamate--ammonia ligase]-adenylyl-L-tyrosine phosphorylase/[glutamate--ammonia-ligase] adenylyltransferase [Pseudomonadota bacterium]MBU1544988.1 bifunctional [glutamate--ammonia ligase]-adenylyl-L-tyrosine phosphorylase/[glutamate--ammonia-ligase] adenylyltransferase [Pseudomonadota bacterium]MBU2480970.1 bifunctiona
MNIKITRSDAVVLDPELTDILENRLESLNESLKKNDMKFFLDERMSSDLTKVLLYSEFIASSVIKTPGLLKALVESQDLDQPYSDQTYSARISKKISADLDVSAVKDILLDIRLYEMIRIAWRDLTGTAQLEETLTDLSNLADAVVEIAVKAIFDDLVLMYGKPQNSENQLQHIIVLGMGKLGAKELNFSSDIDLIFVYPETGNTNGEKTISNEEFFTKLCRRFLKFFSTGVAHSNFYRVDTRLRPYGESGPVVMSAPAFEAYYQAQGRQWERYAMIKARPVAGDIKEGERILKMLNSFIYRRYFDYGSFDSFREMKHRIVLQVKNKKLKNNIKLGPGGIREIEFFGQLFQLIRGGVEPRLQERKILKVLDLLVDHQCIQPETSNDLKQAYVFLRMTENRLQAYADLQTHDIPENPVQRKILALSMGYGDWPDFETVLKNHMQKVHHHFNALLAEEHKQTMDKDILGLKELWANLNDPQFAEDENPIAGFENPDRVIHILKSLKEHPHTRQLTANGRKKLAALIPELVRKTGEQNNSEDILVKLIDLIITIERRTCYLSLLIENTAAMENLINLAQKSPWIIGFISKHPVLLDELMHPDSLYVPPDRTALEKQMEIRMSSLASDDLEYLIEELCVFRQISMLRVSAADVSGNYPLMKVSDHLTYIAEIILLQALKISHDIVSKKYGVPEGTHENDLDHCGFAVIAYGKLGGFEMGYTSDIDIVFLYKADSGMTQGKDRSIENIRFYTNLAQRMIHILTLHTSAGTLYGADMRLRPEGSAGTIVSHIDTYEDYLKNHAWTWEHQALIRARCVAGDKGVSRQFETIRKTILTRKRDAGVLKKEVTDMREQMRKKRLKKVQGHFDLKQSKGGMVDIEFLVQYLVLKEAHRCPDLVVWTDNIRLLESLDAEGIIGPDESQQLQEAYIALRRSIHRLNLQEKSSCLPENTFSDIKTSVIKLYKKYLAQ